MTKWICQLDSREFNSEEAARDAVSEYVDASDFEEVIDNYGAVTFDDIIEELQRLDSPLYHKLMEEIHERIFQNFFYEVADDED